MKRVLHRLLGKLDPEKIIRDHGRQIFVHLKKIFGPDCDIDDVYQIVCIEVVRSLPNFRGEAQLSTWIRRITWNVAYQQMRTRYRDRRLVALEELHGLESSYQPAVDDQAHQNRMVAALYAALDELDPKLRMPLMMRDIHGLTLREVSEQLGRPLQTVVSQVKAARKQLSRTISGVSAPPMHRSGRGNGQGKRGGS